MTPLANTIRKGGFTYTLLRRTERTAIYHQTAEGQHRAYEVHRVQRHDGRTIAGSYVAPAEFLASTEQFGRLAWTYRTMALATKKFDEQDSRPLK